ncbi:MAG: DUF177 domain-containing protein [Saprospiraceae bacterium]|nr:DUF177 domain-containing protein [Saprospiraceae bacterium]
MGFLNQFSLPLSGLKDGVHRYTFTVDKLFFDEFEQSLIENGDLELILDVDKRSHHTILTFDIKGTVAAICDRCLVDIMLPVSTIQVLHLKVGDIEKEDDEVIFISESVVNFNIAQYLYEFICLCVPIIKVYDCANDKSAKCDMEVLKRLQTDEGETDNNKGNELFGDIFSSIIN